MNFFAKKSGVLLTILLSIIFSSCFTPGTKVESNIKENLVKTGIIPAPQQICFLKGNFELSKNTIIKSEVLVTDKMFYSKFSDYLSDNYGKKNFIIFSRNNKLTSESYEINITDEKTEIVFSDSAGLNYALTTLKKLVKHDKGTYFLPAIKISDSPRFSWRGIMLDESRHFFGKEKVMQMLDIMAELKLNRFHWHLTDEPGWRIEIPGYPKLTEIGAKGDYTNNDIEAQFYTVDEVKEIIDYATQRSIIIVPEIDMPGHASAAMRAYPEYSGGGNSKHPDFTFNPGSEETYKFLENILTEVAKIFPGEWIHYGGDEVSFANAQWINLTEVKALMKNENLKNLKEVEYYFNRRMADFITNKLGKTVIGWDEIAEADVSKENSSIMWWRHDRKDVLNKSLHKGYNTILCPRIPCYFDFVQDNSHKWGRRWNGFADIETLFYFPDNLSTFRSSSNRVKSEQIEGIQACIWTEQIKSEARLDFMTFPRIFALAEACWSKPTTKEFENFKQRLKNYLPLLKEKNIYYYNIFSPESTPEPPAPGETNPQFEYQLD